MGRRYCCCFSVLLLVWLVLGWLGGLGFLLGVGRLYGFVCCGWLVWC